jgi:hypothetical protein
LLLKSVLAKKKYRDIVKNAKCPHKIPILLAEITMFLWFSYGFPMVFLWFTTIFRWFFDDFQHQRTSVAVASSICCRKRSARQIRELLTCWEGPKGHDFYGIFIVIR